MKYTFTKRQKVYLVFKRIFDIIGSIFGIILCSPLMVVVAIIIKCVSKGPVFFIQKRYGKNLKIFKIIKFRTMKVDAPEVSQFNLDYEDEIAMTYKFGEFLRKTSIDELPNMFNVLKGDMSFIGPRPSLIRNEEALKEIRLSYTPNAYDVLPGITSYSIVKGYRSHDYELKAKFDSEYVKKMSFITDFKIFFMTIYYIFSKKV